MNVSTRQYSWKQEPVTTKDQVSPVQNSLIFFFFFFDVAQVTIIPQKI
jgi:hypothetical protein